MQHAGNKEKLSGGEDIEKLLKFLGEVLDFDKDFEALSETDETDKLYEDLEKRRDRKWLVYGIDGGVDGAINLDFYYCVKRMLPEILEKLEFLEREYLRAQASNCPHRDGDYCLFGTDS